MRHALLAVTITSMPAAAMAQTTLIDVGALQSQQVYDTAMICEVNGIEHRLTKPNQP